jgi:hypothetical protein
MAKYKVLRGRLSQIIEGVESFFDVGELISLNEATASFLLEDGDIEFVEAEAESEPTAGNFKKKN